MCFRALLSHLIFLVLGALCARGEGPAETARGLPAALWEVRLPELPAERDFASVSPDRFASGVEALLQAFEEKIGRRLTPGDKGKVGLKIYAESGPGLATPQPLVQAVVEALMRRGYERENIFLVGLNQLRLRLTGYLPTDPRLAPPFAGHPFFVLESGRYYDPVWFYDSPLPSRFDPILSGRQDQAPDFDLDRLAAISTDPAAKLDVDADRKSFLATPLFLDADFWINLPVYTDHEALGVNGALVNATLWNASNTSRFFRSTRSAPAAVAEMAAIPELRQTWAFTLATLDQWQFVGGPGFNSLYTRGEPRLWIPDEIRTLEFAETLGLGRRAGGAPTVIEAAPLK
jgi:hypothetical protein